MGRAQLARLESKIERRTEIHHRYRNSPELSGLEWGSYAVTERPNYWLTLAMLPSVSEGGLSATDASIELAAFDIEARPAWKPMHLQPVFADHEVHGGAVGRGPVRAGPVPAVGLGSDRRPGLDRDRRIVGDAGGHTGSVNPAPPAPAQTAVRAVRTISTLGPSWAARRSLIEFKRRSGLLRRRTPVLAWSEVPASARLLHDLFRPERAADHLRSRPDDLAALRERGRRLLDDRFVSFDTPHRLTDWHTDPITGARYPVDVHWTQVPELPAADLKMVWEPARFGWAFDLARLAAVEPDEGWGRRFWELFADWYEANPPNAGVHWSCGQESSLRLMAVTLAASVCRTEATGDDLVMLARFVEQTAERVLSFIDYADSQDNNHLASEAVGPALRRPPLPGADGGGAGRGGGAAVPEPGLSHAHPARRWQLAVLAELPPGLRRQPGLGPLDPPGRRSGSAGRMGAGTAAGGRLPRSGDRSDRRFSPVLRRRRRGRDPARHRLRPPRPAAVDSVGRHRARTFRRGRRVR